MIHSRRQETFESDMLMDGSVLATGTGGPRVGFQVECDGCNNTLDMAPDLMSALMAAEIGLWQMSFNARHHYCGQCTDMGVREPCIALSAATVFAEHSHMDESGSPALQGVFTDRTTKPPDIDALQEQMDDARKVIFGDDE